MEETPPGASILIVDDTLENLRLLTALLGEHGYETRPVTHGRAALQAAEHAHPDLVLLDVTMPEMDGYQVCRQLKANPALSDIPVIFLTSLTDTAEKIKGFAAGGADYISKPFQIDEILARIRTHLGLRQARIKLQQQLESLHTLERLRDDLVHMVVHDMRSPLMVLQLNLELLKRAEDRLDERSLSSLKSATDMATALTRMTNDLLDVSRIEEGKLPLERSRIDLLELAQEVGNSLSSLDRTRTIEIVPGPAAYAECDRELIRRVLENLVGNAIKHASAGGKIRMAAHVKDSHVRIEVEDDGPGVPLDSREKIFDKFETASPKNEHKYHSAGLGLAFCKLVVEAHGGRIGVDDAIPKGSLFWLMLPT